MKKEMFFKSVEFREVQHLAFSDEYITAYVSVNNVPKIHMSVNTPRDEYGFVNSLGVVISLIIVKSKAYGSKI